MNEDPVRYLAVKADQIMERLELAMALILLFAFGTAVYSLAYQVKGFLGGGTTAAGVISFLGTVLMLGILTDVYGMTVDELLGRRSLNGFMVLLIVATSVGILEDWVGALGGMGSSGVLMVAVLFSFMLFSAVLGFYVTS